MILVDTSVWIDFLGDANTRECIEFTRLLEEYEDIALSGIILMEILQGLKSDNEFRKVKTYLLEFPIYNPIGLETYVKAAEIYRTCRKNGKTIRKTVDCIIAAICIEHNLVLFHKDRDFECIGACSPLTTFTV